METALSKLTVLGDWLAYLGVCTYNSTSVETVNDPAVWRGNPSGTPNYNIRNIEHIINHYKPDKVEISIQIILIMYMMFF